MPLTGTAGHAVNRDAAGRVDARCRLVLVEYARRSGLEVGGKSDAAQFALGGAQIAPRREAGPIGGLERMLHHRREIAAVVGRARRRLVRHVLGTDEIAPAQFHRIESMLVRRLVDQTLDRIGDVGPTRAAIRRNRRGIGVRQARLDVDRRHRVNPVAGDRYILRADERTEWSRIGAQVDFIIPAEREEVAIGVHRDFARQG